MFYSGILIIFIKLRIDVKVPQVLGIKKQNQINNKKKSYVDTVNLLRRFESCIQDFANLF